MRLEHADVDKDNDDAVLIDDNSSNDSDKKF